MITCHRKYLEERCVQRGYALDAVMSCVVSQNGDLWTIDIDHPAFPQERVGALSFKCVKDCTTPEFACVEGECCTEHSDGTNSCQKCCDQESCGHPYAMDDNCNCTCQYPCPSSDPYVIDGVESKDSFVGAWKSSGSCYLLDNVCYQDFCRDRYWCPTLSGDGKSPPERCYQGTNEDCETRSCNDCLICNFYTVTVDANQHLRTPLGPSMAAGQYITTSHAGSVTDCPTCPSNPSPFGLAIFAADGTTALGSPLTNWQMTTAGQLYFRNSTDDETVNGCAPATPSCASSNNNSGTHTILMRVCNQQSFEPMPNP